MNLLMCCTPIGREDRYLEELRFVLLGAIYFKKIYPDSQIFVGTTPNAVIPKSFENLINFIRFPFEKLPFALSRMKFYEEFIKSEYFIEDTYITGCDVLFCKKPNLPNFSCQLAMTYRYHRCMPYCSDLIMIKKEYQGSAQKFINNVFTTMNWMPQKIQDGYADQLSLAIEVGFLNDDQFNGETHYFPKNDNMLLLPGNDYLFTPNDFFSSIKSDSAGRLINDTPDLESLFELASTKYVIHFKGNRKNLFFIFSYLCKKNKFIDINCEEYDITDKFLFREYFELFQGK